MKKRKNLRMIICCLCFIAGMLPETALMQERLVRVACFPIESLERDENNPAVSAYERAYLAELAKYAPWRYQYISFADWQDAVRAVTSGGADLMAFGQKASERETRFLYSDYAAGITFEALLVKKGAPLEYEDFAAFQGKRFGMLATYIRKADFQAYCRENGFAGEIKEYASLAALRRALDSGDIDISVENMEDNTAGQRVVGRFASSPYYWLTGKGNPEILAELNKAEAEMRIKDPMALMRLKETYMPQRNRTFFTKSEQDFIARQPVLTVAFLDDRAPLYYYDAQSQSMRGIFIDLFDIIAEKTGLRFRYVSAGKEEPGAFLKEGGADIAAGIVNSAHSVENPELELTRMILDSPVGMAGKKGESFDFQDSLRIAVPKSYRACRNYIQKEYPQVQTILCDDGVFPGLELVLEGKADVVMQNSYVLSYALQSARYDDLALIPGLSVSESLCAGVLAEKTDPRLVAILNKSIAALPKEKVDQLVVGYNMLDARALTPQELLRPYKAQILWACACLVILCGGIAHVLYLRHKNMRQVAKSEQILKNITNNITGGVITLVADKNFTITYANDGFLELVGSSRKRGGAEETWWGITYTYADDRLRMAEIMGRLKENERAEFEVPLRRRDGSSVPTLFRATAACNEKGEFFYYCVIIDISEQKRMMQSIEMEKERYRIVMEQSDSIIFEMDFQADAVIFSEKYTERLGLMPIDTISELRMHPEDNAVYREFVQRLKAGKKFIKRDVRLQRQDGVYIWFEMQASPIYEDNFPVGAIGKLRDIDSVKHEQKQLKQMAERDNLTGLYNKRATRALIESYLNGSGKHAQSALAFIDIDNFKSVNDYQGHLKGDEVLLEITDKIKDVFGEDCIISRFGGDEFSIFMQNIEAEILPEILEMLRQSIDHVYPGEAKDVHISSSIGVARYPNDAAGYTELLERADQALYAAKENGKNRVVFFRSDMRLQGYSNER